MTRLRQRILEGRAAVTHACHSGLIFCDILRLVNMPERHIVKTLKNRSIHIVEATHAFFGIATFGTRHELVSQKHVAATVSKLHLGNRHAHGRSVIRYLCTVLVAFKARTHRGRAHEREHPHIDLAELVLERYRRKCTAIHRRHVHAAIGHNTPAKGNSLRRIVVTAQYEHLRARLGKLHQKFIQYGNRLGGGNRLVIDIASDQERIRFLGGNHLQNVRQDKPLFIEHRMFANAFADMQVCRMD